MSEQKQTEPEVSIQTEKIEPGDPLKSFPDIYEVNLSDKILINHLEYKVACFKAD